jgi:silicon transporter
MEHTTLDYVKMAYSMFLVIFSIVIVTALMFDENTRIAADAHPAVALVVMWAGITWMSMVEGGQCSMVGLPPVNRELYKESHPTTYKICSLGHKGDNLDRYLMGRQFMVIFINFTISLCGAPLAGAEALGLPDWIQSVFLGSGIAMVLTVVTVGQLTAQVNASHCMLDYINNHFMTFTLWMTLIIEKTGVMHSCYLIQYFFYWLAGKPVVTYEEPKTGVQAAFFYGRCLWSVAILFFAMAVTLEGLFNGQTTMWDGVPNGVSVVLFFLLMGVVGMLEGMQIAFFAVSKLPKSQRGEHPMAMKTCELLFRGEGRNLPGFMVGRQMCVTLCFFVVARVTTLDIEIGVDENIFGVSDPVQRFFNMGFLGAIITTILASISWQLVASAFPLEFLSNPLVYFFLQAALLLEATGICSGAWFLGIIHKKISGFQLDEVYIGTPEERAAMDKADLSSERGDSVAEAHIGTNVLHYAPGANTIPDEWKSQKFVNSRSFSERRGDILTNIKDLREQIGKSETKDERAAFESGLGMEVSALQTLNEEQAEEDGVDVVGEEAV